ncbi:helix-turn-helix transcriptional regulator [Puia sp. P3]|uniref:helix-turn-helix transcriptional regulator n=1 Tax=Puia sp. P3 TaxID=3423952 RepID=UPI003D671486
MAKKLKRIRVYLGMKQETLAATLGITQQAVSHIEQQEMIEESLLGQIAEAMGVSPEVIRDFDEEKAIYNISNYNYQDATISEGATAIVQQLNPIEKIVELYERLLKSEREKIEILMDKK